MSALPLVHSTRRNEVSRCTVIIGYWERRTRIPQTEYNRHKTWHNSMGRGRSTGKEGTDGEHRKAYNFWGNGGSLDWLSGMSRNLEAEQSYALSQQVFGNTTPLPVVFPKIYGKTIGVSELRTGVARFFPISGSTMSGLENPIIWRFCLTLSCSQRSARSRGRWTNGRRTSQNAPLASIEVYPTKCPGNSGCHKRDRDAYGWK